VDVSNKSVTSVKSNTTFAEPGAVIHLEDDVVLIADTNNNRLCKMDLHTTKTTILELRFPQQPSSTPAAESKKESRLLDPKSVQVKERIVAVKNGTKVTLSFLPPNGTHLSEEAPR
jgi:hypothetical protein